MENFDTSNSTNPANVSYRNTAVRYGAIWGGVSILLTLIAFLTNTDPGMPETSGMMKALYSVVGIGAAIWAVVMAIKQHRDRELGGSITLGRAIMVGLMAGLVAGAIGAVFMLLYTSVINPDYAESLKAAMQAQWEAQGMSEEQIEMAGSMSGWFTNPVFLFISQIFSGTLAGNFSA